MSSWTETFKSYSINKVPIFKYFVTSTQTFFRYFGKQLNDRIPAEYAEYQTFTKLQCPYALAERKRVGVRSFTYSLMEMYQLQELVT